MILIDLQLRVGSLIQLEVLQLVVIQLGGLPVVPSEVGMEAA